VGYVASIFRVVNYIEQEIGVKAVGKQILIQRAQDRVRQSVLMNVVMNFRLHQKLQNILTG
jgi:hypothetical protein